MTDDSTETSDLSEDESLSRFMQRVIDRPSTYVPLTKVSSEDAGNRYPMSSSSPLSSSRGSFSLLSLSSAPGTRTRSGEEHSTSHLQTPPPRRRQPRGEQDRRGNEREYQGESEESLESEIERRLEMMEMSRYIVLVVAFFSYLLLLSNALVFPVGLEGGKKQGVEEMRRDERRLLE